MALVKKTTFCKIALLLTVTLFIVISEANGKPASKPCEKSSSGSSKRKHSASGKTDKTDKKELKNPFETIECDEIFYSRLHNLASQKFE